MSQDTQLFEPEDTDSDVDPEATPIQDRKLITQPYDLVVKTLIGQIDDSTLHLRPLGGEPRFQRHYVWSDKFASLLIESILLNIPIPPCYFAQNEDFELDVIDGQQRVYSIYRFAKNQFALSGLEVCAELNGKQFFELAKKQKLRIETHTLRCVVITNESHPEIQFDVFERLNTRTMPLNSQELRNCMYRGALNDLLGVLVTYPGWLRIVNRKEPDKRMRDEELALRFLAFHSRGVEAYSTPQKHWLNSLAKEGRKFDEARVAELQETWESTIRKVLTVFEPLESFRRMPGAGRRNIINRALMDLVMTSFASVELQRLRDRRAAIRERYTDLFQNGEFVDLISKSVDHKSRTQRRFQIWQEAFGAII